MNNEKFQKAFEVEKKRIDGTLTIFDVYTYFEALVLICNQSVYAEDELYDMEKIIQFIIADDVKFWLKIVNTKLETGKGEIKKSHIKIKMSDMGALKFLSKSYPEDITEIFRLLRSGDIKFRSKNSDTFTIILLLKFLIVITEEELKDKSIKMS